MPVHNNEIVEIFNEVADLLEIEGANQFRVRAYRNAARTIGGLSQSAVEMIKEGRDLSELPGIGKDLAGKIAEIVKTGTLTTLQETRSHIAPTIRELLAIPGLGPKRIALLRDKLKVNNLADLRIAIDNGLLEKLKGFGPKIEQRILAELQQTKPRETRFKWIVADEVAGSLVDYLKTIPGVGQVTVAGSYRRKMETVGDLDVLVASPESSEVMDRFIQFEEVKSILANGPTRSSVALRCGIQVDLRVVPEISYGAALLYFTGSKPHNIAVRALGLKNGLKINEYGVFRGERQIAGRTEEEVYQQVGLPYIEPELREDRGELDAAREDTLPQLVELREIRGDLHCHTTDSDGHSTLEEMAQAARALGYEYMAITDHSPHLAITRGLDAMRLRQQMALIDKLNEKIKGFRILKSIEVDILEDGSLDLPDAVLSELDIVVGSIHSNFNFSVKRQTDRIIRAMQNPYFTILGHPTGRLVNQRKPFEVDLGQVFRAAREYGCLLEVNAQPDRLDLSDINCRMARDSGVNLVISTDAHSASELNFMRLGVGQARRGWLEAKDVVNTRPWKEFQRLLK